MGVNHLNRRDLLAALSALALTPNTALGEEFIDLDWEDLLPEGQQAEPSILQDFIDHTKNVLLSSQPASNGARGDWNGKIVRIPGYVVPIDYSGTGVTAFILVPFVGACVHVPPPPANQLVFVTTQTPFETGGLYEPVNVIGMFGTASTRTQLAEVAYALSADRIEPF